VPYFPRPQEMQKFIPKKKKWGPAEKKKQKGHRRNRSLASNPIHQPSTWWPEVAEVGVRSAATFSTALQPWHRALS